MDRYPARILIVDDSRSIHGDFEKILSPRGGARSKQRDLAAALFGDEEEEEDRGEPAFALDYATQGREGLELLRAAAGEGRPYQVAFIDMRMPPGWSGLETLMHLWEEDPRLQAVICTAYSDHSWREITRIVGLSDSLLVVKKPFDSIEILQAAHALSRKWLLQRQLDAQVEELLGDIRRRSRELERINRELRIENTERRRAEERLLRLATHDALTGLPNRLLFYEHIGDRLRRARRDGGDLAVMLVDLNDFKPVNDEHGHDVGDELLREVARRMLGAVGERGMVARLGGDEFVIGLGEIASLADAEGLAAELLRAFSSTVHIGDLRFRVGLSVGVAIAPGGLGSVEGLLKSADEAMYCAKRAGGGFVVAELDGGGAGLREAVTPAALGRAIEEDELVLHYQPMFDLGSEGLASFEALVRWEHPTRGLIGPAEFIPVAERCGLIGALGGWVVRRVCRQLVSWRELGLSPVPVSVNISPRQLEDPGFVDRFSAALSASGLAPELIEVEVTEAMAITDFERTSAALRALRSLGVRILLDDFGAGYASIKRIRTLPVDGIKLDRYYIRDITEDPWAASLTSGLMALAQSLDLQVIAEGIERPDQLHLLQSIGQVMGAERDRVRVQGFLFSAGVPASAASALLAGAPPLRESA